MSLPGLDLPTLSFAAPTGEQTQADLLTVDTDHLITSRLLIQGSSGAGKGWAIRTLLEQTHGRVQQIVLDKEGEFSTLREQYDYILAGADGDVPATPKTARVLCHHLMELGASAVIDLYDLTNADRRAFVRDFLTELMALPKEFWRPLLVVIDEAHFYAPEGAPSEAAAAVISLCSEGRKRGYSAVLATQRLSKLSKDAAADLHNKMIGLTGLDVDVRRAADELGFGKDQAATLKKLKAGQFYVYGPAFSPEVTLVRTGEIQTTHPKAGQIAAYTPPPPAEAVQALLEQLKGLAEEAEAEIKAEQEKADRTAALERQVESLQKKLDEKQLAEAPGAAKEAPERVVEKIVEKIVEKVVEVPVFAPGQVEQLRDIADTLMAGGKDMVGMAQEILARVATVQNPPTPILGEQQAKEPRIGQKAAEMPAKAAIFVAGVAPNAPISPVPNSEEMLPANSGERPTKTENVGTSSGHADATGTSAPVSLPRSQQVILDTLAELAQIGMTRPLRDHVALFADVSPKSSGYGISLKALRDAGLIEYPAPSQLALTPAGQEAAKPSARPLTRKALQEAWLKRLKPAQTNLLRHLIACYPNAMSRETLAGYAGVSATSSGYGIHLKALKDLGLVEYLKPGEVSATKLLFPAGLPEA